MVEAATKTILALPEEPTALKARARALLEENPEEGARAVADASFVADGLWREWGPELREAGMDRERFLGIARGFAGELRLWVVGERPWDHCVAGLAGRVRRRLPQVPQNPSENPEPAHHRR